MNPENQASDKHDEHYTKPVPIPLPDATIISQLRIGLICTSWNQDLLYPVVEKTIGTLKVLGVDKKNISELLIVPGSFELPYSAQGLAKQGQVDGIICFGLLIKGETAHFEYISNAASQGLMQAQLSTNIPIVYGILNCLTREQAVERCGPTSQLPMSLAATVVNMASQKRKFYG